MNGEAADGGAVPVNGEAADGRAAPVKGEAVDGGAVIGVLVVDDQPLIRASFRRLVDSAPGFRTAGEAATGLEAVELARDAPSARDAPRARGARGARGGPDVVLMDVRMPVMDGIEATRLICAERPETRVLIVTTFDLDEYVYGALRAGAAGFLLKDTPPADLLKALTVIASGEALLAPTVTRRLIGRFVSPQRTGLPITDREREILVLVATGLSNAEIAGTLYLSLSTVKTHVSSLLTKLGARTRVHLVIAAYESGLIG